MLRWVHMDETLRSVLKLQLSGQVLPLKLVTEQINKMIDRDSAAPPGAKATARNFTGMVDDDADREDSDAEQFGGAYHGGESEGEGESDDDGDDKEFLCSGLINLKCMATYLLMTTSVRMRFRPLIRPGRSSMRCALPMDSTQL